MRLPLAVSNCASGAQNSPCPTWAEAGSKVTAVDARTLHSSPGGRHNRFSADDCGLVVIDVGINWMLLIEEGKKGKLVGDVVFVEVEYVKVIMFVFGGVGLMMIVVLLCNILVVVCV